MAPTIFTLVLILVLMIQAQPQAFIKAIQVCPLLCQLTISAPSVPYSKLKQLWVFWPSAASVANSYPKYISEALSHLVPYSFALLKILVLSYATPLSFEGCLEARADCCQP